MLDDCKSFSTFRNELSLSERILINLWGGFLFVFSQFRKIKYGWWSEKLLIKMPEVTSKVVRVSLQKKLSINVPEVLENLVGNVILGK